MNKTVSLVYATPDRIFKQHMTVSIDSSIHQIINRSELFTQFPELNIDTLTVGIFSEIKGLGYIPKHNDRIEVYRPLKQLPTERRKQQAAKD